MPALDSPGPRQRLGSPKPSWTAKPADVRGCIPTGNSSGLWWHQCVLLRCAQALSGGPEMPAHLFPGGGGASVSPMPGGLAGFSPELLQQQASLLAGNLTPTTTGSQLQVRCTSASGSRSCRNAHLMCSCVCTVAGYFTSPRSALPTTPHQPTLTAQDSQCKHSLHPQPLADCCSLRSNACCGW
jgi:hypothetical protein